MEGKRVSESAVVLAQVMTPQDANPAGSVHGGVIMKLIDEAGGVAAYRHARANVATASIGALDFHSPVRVGNLLTLKASLHLVGSSSMEVGVRVEAEDLLTGEVRHAATAYLTFVALDEQRKPRAVTQLVIETDDEARRHTEAQVRKAKRQAARP
jgi:uncharacterized protein (TIGR00369 family)